MKPCVHSNMNRDNSLKHVMNGSKNPLMIEDFWIGMMMFSILLIQGTFSIMADSSISPESCSIELSALLEAKGMYLTVPTIISAV